MKKVCEISLLKGELLSVPPDQYLIMYVYGKLGGIDTKICNNGSVTFEYGTCTLFM